MQHPKQHRRRILIVDDSVEVASLLQLYLEDDYDVVVKHNAFDAALWLEHERVDLVISDNASPLEDNSQLHRYLRKHPDIQHLPLQALQAPGQAVVLRLGPYRTRIAYEPQLEPAAVHARLDRLLRA